MKSELLCGTVYTCYKNRNRTSIEISVCCVCCRLSKWLLKLTSLIIFRQWYIYIYVLDEQWSIICFELRLFIPVTRRELVFEVSWYGFHSSWWSSLANIISIQSHNSTYWRLLPYNLFHVVSVAAFLDSSGYSYALVGVALRKIRPNAFLQETVCHIQYSFKGDAMHIISFRNDHHTLFLFGETMHS